MPQNQSDNSKQNFTREILQAKQARQEENEGKARVCARRAAGIACGEYLRSIGQQSSNQSAYERLKILDRIPDLPTEVKNRIPLFLMHVTRNHTLPVEVDLIQEALQFAYKLLSWEI